MAQLPALFRRGVVPDNIIPKDGPFPVPREGENLQELCTEGGGDIFHGFSRGVGAGLKKDKQLVWWARGIFVGNDGKLGEL